MATEPLRLTVALGLGDDASPEELDDAARRLRVELLDAGLESVDLARGGAAPPGTKSPEALLLGTLALTLLPAAFQGLAAVVADWAARRPGRTLTLEYGAGASRLVLQYDPRTTDANQLLAALLQAHAAPLPAVERPPAVDRLYSAAPAATVGGDLVSGDKVTHTHAAGDAVGRDKVTHVQVAAGATVIFTDHPPLRDQPPDESAPPAD